MLGSCIFQLYVEFYWATTSLHKRHLISHFYEIVKQKIEKNSSSKLKDTLKIYSSDSFIFQSACPIYFLVIQLSLLPVMFTSRMLSNTEHQVKYICYLVIRIVEALKFLTQKKFFGIPRVSTNTNGKSSPVFLNNNKC